MEFTNGKFIDNAFIGAFGGIDKLVPRGGTELTKGVKAGISFSKYFSPSNGMRITGTWYNSVRKEDNESLTRIGAGVDHLFNVSTFLGGYNPFRVFEVSTVEGLGWQLSSVSGKHNHVFDFHLGLLFNINTGTRINFFIEPWVSFLSDGVDHSYQSNWHQYDVSYGAVIGINYRLGANPVRPTHLKRFEDDQFLSNTFISVSGGVQLQSSELVRKMGLLGSIGPHLQFSVGKWLAAPFGIRLSAFTSYNGWRVNEQNGLDELTRFAGGRLEAMINPVAFFTKNSREHKFGANILLGMEFGKMHKQDGEASVDRSYAGFTGGVQLKYYVTKNMAVFAEPRLSLVPYTFNERDKRTGKLLEQSFVDNICNLSLGIEVRRPTEKQKKTLDALKSQFAPFYYTSANVGLSMPMQYHRYGQKRRANVQVTLAGGRQFTPVSGLRLGIDYFHLSTSYGKKLAVHHYAYESAAVDYLLNVTNFVSRFDPSRKFDAELFAGPVLAYGHSSVYFGGQAGLHLSFRLNDFLGLYLEPRLRVYTKDIVPCEGFDGTRRQASFLLGATYYFKKSK